jgi:lysophospholipase L1-like esterase
LSFLRYVAIGDSSTEGLDDPAGDGRYRGWADRFAAHVAAAQPEPLLYANLAVRGLRTREILETQLERALAMRPDLATVFSGTNDIIRRSVDLDAVAADLRTMHRGFRDAGATVLTITMPDLSRVIPGAGHLRPRLEALNAATRAVCAETGSLCVDLARYPVAVDPRCWSGDRLHANALGHARIAEGLAHRLGLPGFDDSWTAPLPPLARASLAERLTAELRWTRRYLLPWLWRRARGRSSSDGITAKRPELTPVVTG